MACAYASLGAKVTVVEALPRLIAGEEKLASGQVKDAIGSRRRGGDRRQQRPRRCNVRRTAGARSSFELEDGRSYAGDELLVAIGRVPHTDDLGLETLGLMKSDPPTQPVEVDETMRVPGHEWLYVVGDANGRALLTHMGKYQAPRCRRPHSRTDAVRQRFCAPTRRLAPRVIFTEPQVAAVGRTLASARQAAPERARGRYADRGQRRWRASSGAARLATARIVVNEDRRTIVGAKFTGVDVAESLHAATIAVIGEVSLERLWHAVPCFPTRSELWLEPARSLRTLSCPSRRSGGRPYRLRSGPRGPIAGSASILLAGREDLQRARVRGRWRCPRARRCARRRRSGCSSGPSVPGSLAIGARRAGPVDVDAAGRPGRTRTADRRPSPGSSRALRSPTPDTAGRRAARRRRCRCSSATNIVVCPSCCHTAGAVNSSPPPGIGSRWSSPPSGWRRLGAARGVAVQAREREHAEDAVLARQHDAVVAEQRRARSSRGRGRWC